MAIIWHLLSEFYIQEYPLISNSNLYNLHILSRFTTLFPHSGLKGITLNFLCKTQKNVFFSMKPSFAWFQDTKLFRWQHHSLMRRLQTEELCHHTFIPGMHQVLSHLIQSWDCSGLWFTPILCTYDEETNLSSPNGFVL